METLKPRMQIGSSDFIPTDCPNPQQHQSALQRFDPYCLSRTPRLIPRRSLPIL